MLIIIAWIFCLYPFSASQLYMYNSAVFDIWAYTFFMRKGSSLIPASKWGWKPADVSTRCSGLLQGEDDFICTFLILLSRCWHWEELSTYNYICLFVKLEVCLHMCKRSIYSCNHRTRGTWDYTCTMYHQNTSFLNVYIHAYIYV